MATDNHDVIPVRLPSGTKATVILPRPFTEADAEHMAKFLALYIEEPEGGRAAQDSAEGVDHG